MHIQGPSGLIEARFDEAEAAKPIHAVLCHPHPQYGGSMHDAVLDAAAQVLLDHGISCLRFNFRGVGSSEGSYDNGVGEVDDLLAAVTFLRTQNPDHALWLVGYSFGSNIVAKAIASVAPDNAVLVAPPVKVMDFSAITDRHEVYAISGSRDDFIDAVKLEALLGERAFLIEGADHFFSGFYRELSDAVAQIVAAGL